MAQRWQFWLQAKIPHGNQLQHVYASHKFGSYSRHFEECEIAGLVLLGIIEYAEGYTGESFARLKKRQGKFHSSQLLKPATG